MPPTESELFDSDLGLRNLELNHGVIPRSVSTCFKSMHGVYNVAAEVDCFGHFLGTWAEQLLECVAQCHYMRPCLHFGMLVGLPQTSALDVL